MTVLILMGFGLISLTILAVKLVDVDNFLVFMVGAISLTAALIGAVAFCFLSFFWVSAEHKAEMLNSQLGTSYTAEDVFFASSYIDEVREMHRQRIEPNGDLMTK